VEYKSQLKAYNKKLFDPFCRRGRIEFKYNNNKLIITTIGQLNFFRWAIKNKLISYVIDHIHLIDNDIILSRKKSLAKDSPYNLIDTSSDIEDVSSDSAAPKHHGAALMDNTIVRCDMNESVNNHIASKSQKYNDIVLSFG
jgi:hypothetical protein